MRIIFAGTPDFAAEALQTLIDSTHDVIAVYSQPDRPAGRGRQLKASPVKALALQHDIPVYQPVNLKDRADQEQIKELQADVMVVVAYGVILPKAVLDTPRYGCLNIHASILPRWRGAAPIQRAILEGDRETGVTIMQMDVGLDTGDMLTVHRTPIEPEDTGSTLHDRLATIGASALLETLDKIESGTLQPVTQDDNLSNYAKKLDKQEAAIDWNDKADSIVHKIQAFNSWPVAFCDYKGKALRLWQAQLLESNKKNSPGLVLDESKEGIDIACGQGTVRVIELQLPGKKRIMVRDFINSNSLKGLTLG